MKALTLWEPWASFMAFGYKTFETRHWKTNYRGPLAIHAAKTKKHVWDTKLMLSSAGVIPSMFSEGPKGFPLEDHEYPFGKIVAVVDLVDCITTHSMLMPALSAQELALGNYNNGRYAWITENLRKLETPIPCRGFQGLWNVPDEVVARIT